MRLDPQRLSRIFQKLLAVAPNVGDVQRYAKSTVPGFMDLHLEILERSSGYRRIALSHFYRRPSGELAPGPSMTVAVFFDWLQAEALTYRDADRYEQSYPVEGEPPDLAVHTHLNIVLERWLDLLAEEGHLVLLDSETPTAEVRCDK